MEHDEIETLNVRNRFVSYIRKLNMTKILKLMRYLTWLVAHMYIIAKDG